MNAIILAGGRGGRLGRDKTVEKVGGHTMLQRVTNCLTSICDEIIVVIAKDQPRPSLSVEAIVVIDIYPGMGSLGGIYTGLTASSSLYNLVVACDMPFLNPSLLEYLMKVSPGFDVVIPRDREGRLEPLHALYSKNCIDPIDKQLQQGNLKIDGFLDQVNVRYVEERETSEFDPQRLSFFNINTPADLEKAEAMLKEFQI